MNDEPLRSRLIFEENLHASLLVSNQTNAKNW